MTSRLPNARYRDVICRLNLETANILAQAAARESVDVEVILGRIIERYYAADGKTKSERAKAQEDASAEELKKHHRSIGVSTSRTDNDEINRYVSLAAEQR